MTKSLNNGQKRVPLHKQVAIWLWHERYICFWSAIAGALLSVVAMILLRRKLLAITVSLLVAFCDGCQGFWDGMKELH